MLQQVATTAEKGSTPSTSTSDVLRRRESTLDELKGNRTYDGEVQQWGSFNFFYVGKLPNHPCNVELVPENQNGNGKRYTGKIVFSESGLNRFYVGQTPRYACSAHLREL